MSEFDIIAVAIGTYGLVFVLGVYAGRAAVWRELAIPLPPPEPPSPPRPLQRLEDAPTIIGSARTKITKRRPLGGREEGRTNAP